MATQIKKTNNSTVKPTKSEEIKTNNILNEGDKEKEIETLRKENEEKDKKLDELSKNFALMQEQLAKLMSQSSSISKSKDDDEDVLVGCRSIYSNCLATNDGRCSYSFNCDDQKYVSSEDLRQIFRESNRNTRGLFEDDVFYFVNPEDYARFKIKKRVDLSPKNIIRILTTLDTHSMIDEINKMTNSKINFAVLHNFQFEVVKLLIDKSNPLANWKYDDRRTLEEYLGQKFDDLMAAVGARDLLARYKK